MWLSDTVAYSGKPWAMRKEQCCLFKKFYILSGQRRLKNIRKRFIDWWTDGQTARRADQETDGQIDGQTNEQRVKRRDGQTDGGAERRTDGLMNGETDGRTHRWPDGQRDGQQWEGKADGQIDGWKLYAEKEGVGGVAWTNGRRNGWIDFSRGIFKLKSGEIC